MACFDRCCCCLSKKTSAILCTIIILFIGLYSLFGNITNMNELNNNSQDILAKELNIHVAYYYVGLSLNVVIIGTLICLAIGIYKNKLSLMKPFKYIYGLYIFAFIGEIVYYIFIMCRFVKKLSNDEQELEIFCNEYFRGKSPLYIENECQSFKNNLETIAAGSVIMIVIPFVIDLIYYITTFNYISSVEKEEKEIENIKNIENAN